MGPPAVPSGFCYNELMCYTIPNKADSASSENIRVIMVTTGFPGAQNPSGGIFNWRAARALSQFCHIKVVHLRTWLPGRSSIQVSDWEGVPRITVTVPQIPMFDSINRTLYQALAWKRLRPAFEDCDLVHSVGIDFASMLASGWTKRVGVPHVAQVIGSDLNGSDCRRKFVARALEHIDVVACNSAALQMRFQQLYPEARNVRTVWRGVDLDLFCPDGPALGPLTQRPPARFLYLGGFPRGPKFGPKLPYGRNTKGGETLLAAWKAGEKELVQAGSSLLIANLRPGDYQVKEWRSLLSFPGQVELAGPLPPEVVPAYLRACDVLLVPSLQEGLPNVAMEAAACGRTVFGTTVGGLPEVISDRETGLTLPPGDVAALKDAMISYARRIPEVRAMGRMGRSRMDAYFNAKNYPLEMLRVYTAALARCVTAA